MSIDPSSDGASTPVQDLNFDDRSWTGNAGAAATISYSFNPSLMWEDPASLHAFKTGGLSPQLTGAFDDAQKQAAISALGTWAAVAHVTFVNADTSGNSDPGIVFFNENDRDTIGQGDTVPGGQTQDDYGSLNSSHIVDADVQLTQYAVPPDQGDSGYTFTGTSRAFTILDTGGNDLYGGAGDDTVYGGTGNDTLWGGGAGKDAIYSALLHEEKRLLADCVLLHGAYAFRAEA